ncbi:hypothetical protein HF563_05940 [Acidithiobacillus ferridurans]|nr:hypothetical protein [Acidithiobacillus ferridurans]
MSKQIAAAIMAIIASINVVDAATVTAVTPPPAVAKAMASVTHRYCEMVATNKQGDQMQKRLSILGIKTPVRTGIWWPLVLDYKETCEPTKADLHLYEQAHYPMVEMVRHRFHAPVWTIHQAMNFCAKREGVKNWDGGKTATFGQISHIENHCFGPKK